ncbi:MAG TPA: hypothetical protein DEA38_02490 [Stenotrophomonas sp.]|nr:hypothetical protein [Stenotrophomonas sp.]
MSARVFARVYPAGRAMPVTADEHNVVVDLGDSAWLLTNADARQLAIDLFRAASPAAGVPMAADRAEKHLQVQA